MSDRPATRPGAVAAGFTPARCVALLVAALALASCATVNDGTPSAFEEKEYRTGSRIPVRDGHAASPAVTVDHRELLSRPQRGGIGSGGL